MDASPFGLGDSMSGSTALPAPETPALMLVEFTVTGSFDEPDPTEPSGK
jgi:hypothetical protein